MVRLLGELKCKLYALFDSSQRWTADSSQRWIKQESFLEGSHLVAFCPGIAAEAAFPGFDPNPQDEWSVLNRRNGNHADVEGMFV